MPRHLSSDRLLFGSTLVLVLFGVLMVFSASAMMAESRFGSGYYFLSRQLIWAVFGLLVLVGFMHFNYQRLSHPAVVFPAFFLQLALLMAVLLWDDSQTVRRWLPLGKFFLQPSELSKIILVIFMAYFLEKRQGRINDVFRTLLPVGFLTGVTVLLVLEEPDLGTAGLLALTASAMLFAAGMRVVYFGYLAVASLIPLYFLVVRVPYRYDRILAFLNPYSDPLGRGFQIIQSLTAVGSGGVDGLGFMEGRQKLFYLPAAHTDFVFAVVGEELGFIGCLAVLALFGVILWRGIRASLKCRDEFGRLLALGLTGLIIIQVLVNVSVVVGIVPTKGLPLPLLSYGGSSLVSNMMALGILLNISQQSG